VNVLGQRTDRSDHIGDENRMGTSTEENAPEPKGRIKLNTTVERSALMKKVRQTGTSLELEVRRLLRSMGIGFSTKGKGLPGSPDIVNRKRKWVIFVHGCYWHAHEGCRLWKIPTRNSDFWREKFERNRERDARKIRELEALGFAVFVIWQCNLEDAGILGAQLSCFFDGIRQRFSK
jgi:DNA mismatch endonuclease (patch repair protein)